MKRIDGYYMVAEKKTCKPYSATLYSTKSSAEKKAESLNRKTSNKASDGLSLNQSNPSTAYCSASFQQAFSAKAAPLIKVIALRGG